MTSEERQMYNNALKPCPFCGSTDLTIDSLWPKATLLEVRHLYEHRRRYFVFCYGCCGGNGWYTTPEKAVENWNYVSERVIGAEDEK